MLEDACVLLLIGCSTFGTLRQLSAGVQIECEKIGCVPTLKLSFRQRLLTDDLMVWSLAFSPDGLVLAASLGYQSGVQVWDLPDFQARQLEPGGQGQLTFLPDGRFLARAGALWDVASGAIFPSETLGGELAFSPDQRKSLELSGRYLYPAELTGEGLRLVKEDGIPAFLMGLPQDPCCLAFNPNAARNEVATGDAKGWLLFWNPDTWQEMARLPTLGPLVKLAYAPAGNLLACGHQSGQLTLWDPLRRTMVRQLALGQSPRRLAFTADGLHLLVAGKRALQLVDVAGGEVIDEVESAPRATTFAVCGSSGWLAEGIEGNLKGGPEIAVWQVSADPVVRRPVPSVLISSVSDCLGVPTSSQWQVMDVGDFEEGGLVAGLPQQGPPELWQFSPGVERKLPTLAVDPERKWRSICLSDFGPALAAAMDDQQMLVVWDPLNGELRGQCQLPSDFHLLALSETRAALATPEGQLKVIGLPDGRALFELNFYIRISRAAFLDASGRLALAVGERLWLCGPGLADNCRFLEESFDQIHNPCVVTPHGQIAIVQKGDNVALINLKTQATLARFREPDALSACVTAQGRAVAVQTGAKPSPGSILSWKQAPQKLVFWDPWNQFRLDWFGYGDIADPGEFRTLDHVVEMHPLCGGDLVVGRTQSGCLQKRALGWTV